MSGRAGVLAIHPGALGDVILFARRVTQLDGPATLVCRSAVGRMLAELGVIARHLAFDDLPWEAVFSDDVRRAQILRDRLTGCGRLVSCFGQGDAAAEGRLSELAGADRSDFLPIRPPAGSAGHLVELWTRQLRAGPVDASAWPMPEALLPRARQRTAELGLAPDRPTVWLHPGAGGAAKCWPIDRYVALGRDLARRGRQIAYVVGPVEMETWPDDRGETLRSVAPVWEAPDLGDLAAALSLAGGFVGNDSGVGHLAAAVGCPTLTLFGPTDATNFAPIGPRVRTLQTRSLADLSAEQVAMLARRYSNVGKTTKGEA